MAADQTNLLVKEGWTGEGRRDTVIEPLKPEDDGLHTTMGEKGMYEWWYFDAHLDTGHTVVAFFHASNPNPGMAGRSGVELVLLRPDGRKTQKFIKYAKSEFIASSEKADVTVGKNYLRIHDEEDLPIYEIHLDEGDLEFHLEYKAEVRGWKPGTGKSTFGDLGYFAWVVPFPKAAVQGTIRDGEKKIRCRGVGYHDHNWLNFPFHKIIDFWMWGRIYSKTFTLSYAFIQCNQKMENHAVKVLMLAEGKEVILSTGEFSFDKEAFEYHPDAKYRYPKKLTIKIPEELEVTLSVRSVLEAEDMLDNFNPVLAFIAKNLLRLKPAYFRLESDFEIAVTREGVSKKETGTTLHEIVLFKPVSG